MTPLLKLKLILLVACPFFAGYAVLWLFDLTLTLWLGVLTVGWLVYLPVLFVLAGKRLGWRD